MQLDVCFYYCQFCFSRLEICGDVVLGMLQKNNLQDVRSDRTRMLYFIELTMVRQLVTSV
jgi:hypothetical protein